MLRPRRGSTNDRPDAHEQGELLVEQGGARCVITDIEANEAEEDRVILHLREIADEGTQKLEQLLPAVLDEDRIEVVCEQLEK